ncbi:MAG TPA: AraC family transcriptional regulator [Rudaea sp.]|nr:AraC family transcriptional regulator [Rudaea sp.]
MLAHIEARTEDSLSLEELSEVAALSRHHFHRQFSGFLGMSAYKYVQFMRMRRASWRLAYRPELSVADIALATGYEGPEAFARAFRQFSGQSPSDFRESPDWSDWHSRFRPFIHLRQNHMNTLLSPLLVRVVQFPGARVASIEHVGSPLRLGDTVRAFIEWRRANKLPPRLSATYNIVYNDPDETPPEEFRFRLCAATEKAIEPNDAGVTEMHIPAGRCALLRHVGSDDQLGRSIMHLYATWLPGSGEELREFPLFMQRVAFFPDVPDSEAVTDIYLPLR